MGRPLKIRKSTDGVTQDIGYPNDGTTDNGFSASYPGIVGGDIPNFNASFVISAAVCVEQVQYGTIVAVAGVTAVSGFGTAFNNVLTVGSLVYAAGIEAPIGVVNTLNADFSTATASSAASNERSIFSIYSPTCFSTYACQ